MSDYYSIVTEKGLEEVMKAVNEERKVNIVSFAVGDGGGAYFAPEACMTELKNETWRGAVNSCKISEENVNVLVIESIISADVGGFVIREMAVFDDKGNMIAICNTPDTQKVKVSDGVVHELQLRMEIALNNIDSIQLVVDPNVVVATKKDFEKLQNDMEEEHLFIQQHIEDNENPHKQQDAINTALRSAEAYSNDVYQQSTGYTDQKIADLIDGAPETLGTLKEVAEALTENQTVIEALDAAIGKKANQSEFDTHVGNSTIHVTSSEKDLWNNKLEKTGDTQNNIVTFTSGDSTAVNEWTDISVLKSKEKHSSLFAKISTMFKNVRYLYKMLGTTDISAISDGTVTGAISGLNTDLSQIPVIQAGTIDVATERDIAVDFTVTFPKPFQSYPAITLTPYHATWNPAKVKIKSKTPNGFTGNIYVESGAGTYSINWIAVGV